MIDCRIEEAKKRDHRKLGRELELFTFDEEVNEDDAIVYSGDFLVLVDAMSYPYLAGAEIDYIEDLSGAQFSVTNPNASSTCGCGNSFSV